MLLFRKTSNSSSDRDYHDSDNRFKWLKNDTNQSQNKLTT